MSLLPNVWTLPYLNQPIICSPFPLPYTPDATFLNDAILIRRFRDIELSLLHDQPLATAVKEVPR